MPRPLRVSRSMSLSLTARLSAFGCKYAGAQTLLCPEVHGTALDLVVLVAVDEFLLGHERKCIYMKFRKMAITTLYTRQQKRH